MKIEFLSGYGPIETKEILICVFRDVVDFFCHSPVWSKNEKNSAIFIFAPLKFSNFQKFAKVGKLR